MTETMVDIVMPQLGLTMESGIVVEWLRQDGDMVVAGEPLFVVETEKSNVDVDAQESGTLHILPDMTGVDLSVGSVIGKIEKITEMATAPSPSQPVVATVADQKSSQEPLPQQQIAVREDPQSGPPMQELQLAARPISPLRPMVLPEATLPPKPILLDGETTSRFQNKTQKRPVSPVLPMGSLVEKTTSLSSVRKVIADNMSASAHTTAAVTLTTEVDATQLVLLRHQLKEEFQKGDLIIPTFNDLILALVARCLAEYPEVNSVFTETSITQKAQVDIGLAIDTPRGLLVPVIRNVLNLSLWELAEATKQFIDLGHKGQLLPDDLVGGTFTITNLGMYDIDAFTPIINMPQVAILGIGSIRPRPVSSDGRQVVIKDTVILSLTFDHRLIDGAPAARFLQRIKVMIEHINVMLIAFP